MMKTFYFAVAACLPLLIGCIDDVKIDVTPAQVKPAVEKSPTVFAEPSSDIRARKNQENQESVMPKDESNAESSAKSSKPFDLTPKFNPLDPAAAYVILKKGTEPRSDGGYTLTKGPGHLHLPTMQRTVVSQ